MITTREIKTRGFTFRALEAGAGGEPVLLLHGFPETSLMWTDVMTSLADAGYHCLAPDQRGYSPGARPADVDAYSYEELAADALALGRSLGERFHLVGHDWGAIVGWLALATDPSPVASWTSISIPHYTAWARCVYEDPAMQFYRERLLGVWLVEGDGEASITPEWLRTIWASKPKDRADGEIARLLEPGAITAALNWYRASRGHKRVLEDFEIPAITTPTLHICSTVEADGRPVQEAAPLMAGEYRVAALEGTHFIVDDQPQRVAEETLAHLRAHAIR
ncbi:MAG TPA: alpha/beta hydrolase [Dehalococcoidia bacterium]|nr:alpha/beta hydrolase [Dehalococcoidia bacterium]